MTLLYSTLGALLPLFALIAVGVALRRRGLVHREHAPVLNNLVLTILLPASILRALLLAPKLSPKLMVLPLLIVAMEVVALGFCLAVGLRQRLKPGAVGAVMLTSTFGNTAFLGYPVAQALFPVSLFPAAMVIDQFGMMLVLYPFAAVLAGWLLRGRHEGEETPRDAVLRFLRGPLFLSVVAGLLLRFLPLPAVLTHQAWAQAIAAVAATCLQYLAQATAPVILIALGIMLTAPPGGLGKGLGLAAVVKLALCPLLIVGLCHLAGLPADLRRVTVQQSCMPSGMINAVLCSQHGLDADLALQIICVTTALSAITIPLWMTLIR